MYTHKILNIASGNAHLQNAFSKEIGISSILAQVLINRGVKNIDEADRFINVRLEHLLDPYSFSQMPQASKRIREAARNQEKVMVFGDYDVDGITSLALLKAALAKVGLHTAHYLPHRVKEGYGLNKNIIALAKEKNIKLIITVDCGTNNQEEIQELKRQHIDVIITDHHEPINCVLPAAVSILNPKVKGTNYKYRDLAGVGVAYKLAQAITEEDLFEELDLVSLGTIADVVPLTGENRIIAKEGLKRLSQTKRPGLNALIEVSGIKGKSINSHFVSFILGPRLNASGRMDTAEIAVKLLMSEDKDDARTFARIIDTHNRQRQKIETKILEEAEAIISKEINFKEHKIIVIASEGWHPGVLGIVASKLTDRFYRPSIVISLSDDLCKGSARSIKNFHLFNALSQCRHLLEEFGGHAHAAGLVISKNNIKDFRESINRLAREKLLLEDLLPSLDIDMELGLEDLNEENIRELQLLEPFGTDNPEPLFFSRNLRIKGEPQVLSKNTLKFWVTDGTTTYQAIAFGMSGLRDNFTHTAYFDLAYTPRIDTWQGEESVILEAKDIFFR